MNIALTSSASIPSSTDSFAFSFLSLAKTKIIVSFLSPSPSISAKSGFAFFSSTLSSLSSLSSFLPFSYLGMLEDPVKYLLLLLQTHSLKIQRFHFHLKNILMGCHLLKVLCLNFSFVLGYFHLIF